MEKMYEVKKEATCSMGARTPCRVIIDLQSALSHPPAALTHFALLFALQTESFWVIL